MQSFGWHGWVCCCPLFLCCGCRGFDLLLVYLITGIKLLTIEWILLLFNTTFSTRVWIRSCGDTRQFCIRFKGMKRHRTLLNTSVLTISVVLVRLIVTNTKVWDQQWFQKFLKSFNVKFKHWLRWKCRRFSASFGKRHIERNKSPIYTQCGWGSIVVSNVATLMHPFLIKDEICQTRKAWHPS